MIKIDLTAPLEALDGTSLPDNTTQARVLANSLVSGPEGDAIKCYDWGVSLYRTGIIEVDASDLEALKSLVKANQRLSNLAKGPILKTLNAAGNGKV
jgi:hypothetical protein